jgi:hypothetical protein
MKKTVIFLSKMATLVAFSVLMMAGFSSCTNDEPDSFLNKYTGSYSGTETYTAGGIAVSNPYTVVVTKSSERDKVVIMAEFMVPGRTESIPVEVSKEGSFVTSFASVVDGVSQTVVVSSGKFDGKKLNYSYYV